MTQQPYVTLNDGNKIPQLGLGVWRAADGDEVVEAVKSALTAGYRSIDTAMVYRNEAGVGQAIRESQIPRDELFITTKLWNSDQGSTTTAAALDASLKRLGLDYVDMYLIHWPMPEVGKFVETWKVFEELQAAGKVRTIGVSNFQIAQLEELKKHSSVVPAVNQIELHPYFQQVELREYARENGIHIESWSPIGHGGDLLNEPILKEIAEHHHKTPAQVVIRWHLQNDLIVIPKSVHDSRIKENFDVFDFSLTSGEINAICTLETGERIGANPDTMNSQ
jgi:diketogulonate reductase-like aldo/keto reductase